MFSGKLFNRFSGISKKSGNPFYSVDILVDQADGSRVTFKTFVSEEIYTKVSSCPLDTPVSVRCGVNGFGNLCVTDIITSNK